MKKIGMPALLFALTLYSCQKKVEDDCNTCYLKAVVIDTSDVSCEHPVLDFSEDSVRVFAFSGKHQLQYIIHKLPAAFTVLNKKLYISVSTDVSKDSFACHAYGTPYPLLHFVEAKDR